MRPAAILLLLGALAIPVTATASDPAPADETCCSESWLGVWLGDAVDGGVQIVALVPGGPAEIGGILPGDILIEANGRSLASQADLSGVLDLSDPGDRLSLVVLRRGGELKTDVTVGIARETPPIVIPDRVAVPAPPAPPVQSLLPGRGLGLRVAAATPGLRTHFGAPAEAGVLVTRVEPGRIADRSGIRVGDVVIQLGERTILTPAELELAVLSWSHSEPLKAQIVRDRATRTVELTAEQPAPAPADVISTSVRVARERAVRLQIERLERRIAELRKELDALQPDRD